MRQRRSIPARLLAAGLLQAAAALTPMPSGAGEKPADAQPWSPPNWQVEAARVVAKRALTDQLAAALRTTLLTDRNALLSALESLAAREDLSWPQREAALLQFVQSLDDLRRDQVPPAALALLAQWQPRTLVPHEEMSTLGTPLFDIAARTHGVLNRWRREEGRRRAIGLGVMGHG